MAVPRTPQEAITHRKTVEVSHRSKGNSEDKRKNVLGQHGGRETHLPCPRRLAQRMSMRVSSSGWCTLSCNVCMLNVDALIVDLRAVLQDRRFPLVEFGIRSVEGDQHATVISSRQCKRGFIGSENDRAGWCPRQLL